MKPILRLLWLIGYIPVLIVELIGIILCTILFYFIGGLYCFIKTGDIEEVYDEPFTHIEWIDEKYKDLLDKI